MFQDFEDIFARKIFEVKTEKKPEKPFSGTMKSLFLFTST